MLAIFSGRVGLPWVCSRRSLGLRLIPSVARLVVGFREDSGWVPLTISVCWLITIQMAGTVFQHFPQSEGGPAALRAAFLIRSCRPFVLLARAESWHEEECCAEMIVNRSTGLQNLRKGDPCCVFSHQALRAAGNLSLRWRHETSAHHVRIWRL